MSDSGMFGPEGLLGGSCGGCGRRHFPLAEWCPWCGTAEPATVRLSTHGTLWSWTTVLAAPPGYTGPVPFGFGVVELPEDGLRIVTHLTETEGLEAGRDMTYTVVSLDTDHSTWAFRPL